MVGRIVKSTDRENQSAVVLLCIFSGWVHSTESNVSVSAVAFCDHAKVINGARHKSTTGGNLHVFFVDFSIVATTSKIIMMTTGGGLGAGVVGIDFGASHSSTPPRRRLNLSLSPDDIIAW